jgi:microsomal dipeptidase-like Zn-dependent dipeptidase
MELTQAEGEGDYKLPGRAEPLPTVQHPLLSSASGNGDDVNFVDDSAENRTHTILAETPVWDNHGCLPNGDADRWLPHLIRYRDAGVSAATINIGDSDLPLEALVRTAARIRYFVKQNPQTYLLGHTTADIREAKRSGRLAIFLDVEGLFALADQLR